MMSVYSGTRVSTVFMPDYARVIGIPLDWISFLLSVTGIFNTGSKIAAGLYPHSLENNQNLKFNE